MKTTLKTIAAVLAALSLTAGARATTIDFEAGTIGNAIGGFYSGLGVTFANASFTSNFGYPGSAGSQGMGDITDPINPPYNPGLTNRIVLTFSTPVSAFSINAIDVGADGARLEAFDSPVGGLLVGFGQFIGAGDGTGLFATLGVSAPIIYRVELYQPLNVLGSGDGIVFDQATFTQAPEPTTLSLLGAGVAALTIYRRRK